MIARQTGVAQRANEATSSSTIALVGILTPFERRLLALLGQGMNRTEIGVQLHLSRHTVTHALTVAKEKLGARTLTEAVVRSIQGNGG